MAIQISNRAEQIRHANAALDTALDTAVRAAYGLKQKEDILAFLLTLNLELAAKESKGEPIAPPGLPTSSTNSAKFISKDCVTV